ncbi:Hypothetical protein D9617_16g015420 [Elsinoe fawcettii]|nr:Hypothetical protein D9617_16g015420 [Elsinoe fawcettii]
MTETTEPINITGGCNCGALRYDLNIPVGTKLPLEENATCMCTLCRKFTGSIVPRVLQVYVSWSSIPLFFSSPQYKTYKTNVIEGVIGYRGFCSECGSSLTFHNHPVEKIDNEFEIFLGTVDEHLLAGKDLGEEEGKHGPRTKRGEGIGSILTDCSVSGHDWLENSVPGFNLKGPKRWRKVHEKEFEFDDFEQAKKTG